MLIAILFYHISTKKSNFLLEPAHMY